MHPKFQTKGIQLPEPLREQLEQNGHKFKSDDNGKFQSRTGRKPKISRKELRQQERLNAKQRRMDHFTQRSRNARVVQEEDSFPLPLAKRRKLSEEPQVPQPHSVLKEQNSKATKDPASPMKSSVKTVGKPRTQREKNEDAYITMLEAKLGIKKSAKKGKSYGAGFEDDGLLDLLEGLDTYEESENDFDKTLGSEGDSDAGLDHDSEGPEGNEQESEEYEEEAEEWAGFSGDVIHETAEAKAEVGTASTSETRYVPPHLRAQKSSNAEPALDQKLSRTVKGLLNRLSEQNMATMVNEIQNLYQAQRRHEMTRTITKLILDGISSHSSLLDSYVAMQAALIECLHKLVGLDFAAFFVQETVTAYEKYYTDAKKTSKQSSEDESSEHGKECTNLLLLIAELYNFQVISCTLVHDLIRTILEGELDELDIELLLKITRSAGSQLRHDDPSALKDIVDMAQIQASSQKAFTSSRSRFMMETLVNLKNNKVKKQNDLASETAERLRRVITSIVKKRHVLSHEPLRVTLKDLHDSETKGKWWLVGAAWNGNPLVEHEESAKPSQSETAKTENAQTTLLKLAKKQGMNTDIRRSIFVVLMSSEDYVDACERLSQLNLTELQQREVIRVLVHCCGNEKSYNPYYTFVAQHLCKFSHSHKITLQFCLWDFLRGLGEKNVGGAEMIKTRDDEDQFTEFDVQKVSKTRIANVARAFAWWIAKDAVNITVLKPVEFLTLKSQAKEFFKQFFVDLFVSTQVSSPVSLMKYSDSSERDRAALEVVMTKALRISTLTAGIKFFLSSVVERSVADITAIPEFVGWACEVAKEVFGSSF